MKLKPIAAIIVLSLVVACLLVAGCTTSNTNQTTSTTPSTANKAIVHLSAQHDEKGDSASSTAGFQDVKISVSATNIPVQRVPKGCEMALFKLLDSKNELHNLENSTCKFTGTGGPDMEKGSYTMSIEGSATRLTSNASSTSKDITGVFVFTIRNDAKPVKLMYNDGADNITVAL